MTKKKTDTTEAVAKPKRKSSKASAKDKVFKTSQRKSSAKKTKSKQDQPVEAVEPIKAVVLDKSNPFKLASQMLEDREEISLTDLLDMLSETDNEECGFELEDENPKTTGTPRLDARLLAIEARFNAVVGPIMAKYECEMN